VSTKKVPIVAIVGRANVGKSNLFNALLGRREAIVADEPGTTRDSITAKAELESGKQFWLVDTAGLKDAADAFELTIQDQIIEAANSADIILVTVDGTSIVTDEDRRVTKLAFKSGKDIILLVNKSDKAKKDQIKAFEKLGIKTIIPTSATQKRGFEELEEALEEVLPAASIVEADDRIRIALLGRPNVGKSSLYNAMAKKQQAIVADRAGTTRDVNRTLVKYMGREIEILDTAGIRRSGRIERGVEHFSVLRSLSAIEQADVCLLLIDANELSVALDQKIAGMIKEAGKGLVIVVSKWDTKEKDSYTRDEIAPGIARDFQFVPWAPLVFTSSVEGKNVTKLFEISLEIMNRRAQKISTRDLNAWLKRVTDRHPPAGLKNRQPKLRYMVQEDDNPIPAFKIFGAHTKYLHWSYKRHMEKMMRMEWDYTGTAIQLWFIDRDVEKERDIKLGGKTSKKAKKFKNNGNRDLARRREEQK
jgi:GTP-binding protein